MDLSILGELLTNSADFNRLRSAIKGGQFNSQLQVLSEATPLVLSSLHQTMGCPILVVVPRPAEAQRLYEQVLLWTDTDTPVLHFQENETLPFERMVQDLDTAQERIRGLWTLVPDNPPSPLIIASVSAIAQKTISRDTLKNSVQTFNLRQQIDLDQTINAWNRMGYRTESLVDLPGLVSRRGGILDIFPVSEDAPLRIELWGDEIDSIRYFDPDTQRSTTLVESITIIPAQETLPGLVDRESFDNLRKSMDMDKCAKETRDRINDEIDLLLEGFTIEDVDFYSGFFNTGSLLDYLADNTLIVNLNSTEISEAALEIDERSHQLRKTKEQSYQIPTKFPSSHFLESESTERGVHIQRRLEITPWGSEDLLKTENYSLPCSSPPDFGGQLESFVESVAQMSQDGDRIIVVSSASSRLEEIMTQTGLEIEMSERLEAIPVPGAIVLFQAWGSGLNDGIVLTDVVQNLVILSDSEIFGTAKLRRTTRRRMVKRETLLSELNPGDYVVHVEHGVGRFLGTKRTARDEGEREFLVLSYARGDELYVPMVHIDRISPYVAPLEKPPSLNRLGTQEWTRTKERVEHSTREMAAELLSLYASRELAKGYSYPPDTPWQNEMEDAFIYQETQGQQDTLADVKLDMEQTKPMDRLICGDVGYGKTEIALRAAFKAVMAGKQVAVLVPTTVLAQQHFSTFKERMQAFPISVEVLSRFRTESEQRRIVNGLSAGTVDICIGTHRLIQKDVSFKNLGLVIIDEEQRFGVSHKERLKDMRHEVDVLTLTATPIPRTLHLALAGIRDMSTIETPPEERLSIKTYVSEFSDDLIREAIRREIDRQGQVFFVHNRVHNIDYMANYIRSLVPEAKVGIGHGQMPENQLERAMIEFSKGRYDVLVCTTIIESGLDIPNANSLIINRADAFGLAQLYQLRGRIGRSERRAYAYLLIPAHRSIKEIAEKRLKTMLAATELGAGFQIAMKDLEIRGAGNVLGSQQSGHIAAVGFDLYTKLLSEAVETLRAHIATTGTGEGASDPAEIDLPSYGNISISGSEIFPAIDLGIPASIPATYVTDLQTRLDLYRRIGSAGTKTDLSEIDDEMVDRFGTLPWQIENLLYIESLKLSSITAGVESISRTEKYILLKLRDDTGGARDALQKSLGPGVKVGHTQIRLDPSSISEDWEVTLPSILKAISSFRNQISSIS